MADIKGGIVTVMVSSLDSAIQFYTDTLGLNLVNRYGDHWADIEAPGIAIGLHPTSREVKIGNNLQIGFQVADIDKTVAALEKKGVRFQWKEDDQVRLASFADPDGNTLYLSQPQW